MPNRKSIPAMIVGSFLAITILASNNVHAADKMGLFTGKTGHQVAGKVTLKTSGGKTVIQFSNNFRSQSGPDLYVYVGGSRPSKLIAKLRKMRGAQSYRLPSGISPASAKNVYIYCKAFSVQFGAARLR